MALQNRTRFKADLKIMFRWAILKAFEKYNDVTTSRNELARLVQDVWDELVDDGEIILEH